MSGNENSIYIFVKGNKGRFAYEITDYQFNTLHSDVDKNLTNQDGSELWQNSADFEAMIASLKYIVSHKGTNGIPDKPIIFVFTTFENNYQVASEIKKPNATYKYKTQLEHLEKQLSRGVPDPDVRYHWIPNNFQDRMSFVKELLSRDKFSSQRKPPWIRS